MAVIEQNPNVTLGDWRSDGNYATANRICTYADLVDKTLPVSGDVLHELGGSSNINNVYIINGRQTLTYLQLSHCEDLKVYLKTSSATGEQHMYRFNGEVKQLCRFSCKETDSLNDNVPYKYNLCVTVSDIECIENTKEVRFRFKNITFRPCIKFIVGGSGVEWCSLVEVERENDLTNPHDIYIKMKNGLKAKFAIELYDSQSGSEYIYIGSDGYYGGSIKEYDSSYGGAVNLTYTSYDSIIPPVDWLANQTQEFIVEPYLENAQVTLTGTRNTPIYIEIETDSRFTVRNMTHAKFAEACNDTYENQAEYGVLSVIPGDYAGYFMTPIADPGHAYVTLMSQDVNQWDRFEGTVEEYDTNGNPTHEQPWEIKLQSFSPEVPSAWTWGPMNWGIEIHKKCNGEKFVHKYSYKLKLISRAAFYPTTVNVVEWRNLSIKYLPSETEIIDVSSQPSGQKWIHTFYTKETETPQNITLKAIVKSDSIEAGEMGYNATYAIVKVSLSTNQNNKLVSFALDGSVGPGAYAVVPYVHSSSIMPRSLELYMRVLPNVTVNFMFPNGYQVQKEGGSYESGEPINAYYNTVQLQFDAETVQSEKITISIKRNQAGNHGYNYLTPSFYYNSSWSGGVALEVTFSGLAGKTFDVGQSTAVIANHVSFALGTTEFSIRFAGSQRSALALTFIIPSFRSGCLNNYAEVAPAADSTEIGGKGGYFGPMLVDQEQIEGSCAIYQGNSNELIVSVDGRPDSWIGATGYSYSFDISDTLIKIVPKTLSGVATIQNGYLPSTIYKEVTATGNDLTVESTPRTLTSSIYEPLTYSSTSPMFKFTINNGASAPAATLTAVKWSDTDIYIFSMNTVIEGESGHFDIRGITSGSEGTAGTKFNFSTTAASVPTSYSGSETNHLKYTFVLPDWFYGIKNGHKRTFRMDMNRSIWAGKQNTATGGTHLKGIEKYRIVAYREYNPNGSSGSQIFDKILNCTGDYTEFRLDNLTTNENIFNIASNLGRPMALVIVPIEGEPLFNIESVSWWNGTSMQSATFGQDTIYLSPIMRENSIIIDIKCRNASDTVTVSFGTLFSASTNDGATVYAKVLTLSGVPGKTHRVTVWSESDFYAYNESHSTTRPYYTNKNITLKIRCVSSATQVDIPVDLTVGPVINFVFSSPTYVSQKPATTSGTFTTKVLEYVKDGSNDKGRKYSAYPTYPTYDPSGSVVREHTIYVPDLTNWVTKYAFKWCKWSGSGSSDTFTTYFLNPINGSSTGEYTLRSKDTFPGGEELIPTGTVDAFVEYTYHPLNNDAWYPNANSHKTSSTVKNFMTISNVSWWNGLGEETTTLSNAFLSPIKRGSGETVASLSLQFISEHGLNLSGAYITTSGPITINTTVAAEVVLSVSIKLTEDLGRYNDGLSTRIFYTGMKVPFYVTIPKITSGNFTDTFYMTLGPVIAIHHEVASGSFADGTAFGGNLKPETGHKIVLQSRAHEWYKNDSGVVVDTGNDAVGASAETDRIRRGRQYAIIWKYNDDVLNETLPTSGCPIVDLSEILSGESVYQYTREFRDNGHHLRVQHAASWTGASRYYQDWGAWRVYVENGSGLVDGTLTAQVTVNDLSSSDAPEISMKHWYDNGKTTYLSIYNIVVISSITYYDGHQMQSCSNINAIPLSPMRTNSAIRIEGSIPSSVVISSININMPTGSDLNFSASHSTPGVTTFWINILTDDDVFEFNEVQGPIFYTGQQFICSVDFSYVVVEDGTSTTKTCNMPFTCVLGPVLKLNASNSNLKPAYNETTQVTVRASEYYKTSSGTVQRQDNINCGGGINASTTNPDTGTIYNLAWNYSGGTIGVAGSTADVIISNVSPTGLYTLKSNKTPEAPEGTITAAFTIDSTQGHYWYNAAVGTVSVCEIKVLGAEYYNGMIDEYEPDMVDVGTNFDEMLITSYPEVIIAQMQIYLFVPEGNTVSFNLASDNPSYIPNIMSADIINEEGEYNGEEYNKIAVVGTYREMIDEYDSETCPIYSGQEIHLQLSYGSSTIDMHPKLGTFGTVNFGTTPVQVISGIPSRTSDTITELPAFCTIIEQSGAVTYPIGSPKLLYDFSVDSNSLAVVTYDVPSYAYEINVKQYDETAWIEPQYGCGSVVVKLKLNEPWFRDWMGTREIVFEKYLNFVTGYSSEAATGQYYALASSDGSMGLYSKSSSMINGYSNYQLSPILKYIDGNYYTLYYITFKVTLNSAGYSSIRHITPSDSEGKLAGVYFARMSSIYTGSNPVSLKTVTGGDFNWSLVTQYYEWSNYITLVHSSPTSSSPDSNGFYNYRWLSPGGSGYSRPSYDWHLKYGETPNQGKGIESIKCWDLDDFPIWSPQWNT